MGKESTCNAGSAGDAGLVLGPRRSLERAWHPIPVFLCGESHWQRSLVGYGAQNHKESYMSEATEHALCIELNNQDDNIQSCHTPLPNLNQSIVSCSVLTMFLDPHTGFSGDRQGNLVFPRL